VAIDFLDRRITYAELERHSGRVAGFLEARGVGPGQRIGFCFDKSPEALVCLFGLIRTGATYVPADPHVPSSRIAMIWRDCGIRGALAGVLPKGLSDLEWAVVARPSEDAPSRGRIISLEDVLAEGPSASGPVPAPEGGIANILYTSGSTGQPKGAMITTNSLMHFSRWGVETFGITAADRVSNHAPYSFDLSTFDIFAAVRAGATMCPVPESARGYPYRLARFMAGSRITIWYSVPWCLVLMAMRGNLPSHDLSRLRHVLFAGEVMPPSPLRAWIEQVPQATYWNLYGPTETNVCTFHRVQPEDLHRPEGIPIGRPITDTRAWIVDMNGARVRAGEPGELLVSGPTVFAGYFGKPEATREQFVPAPDGQGFAYKTGDNVLDKGDGALLFLGRCDRRIKCKGYRLELAEVEAVVVAHPAVAEAAVLAAADGTLNKFLVAFVSIREGHESTAAELSAHCRRYLPNYMVPSRWRFLDRLPRNPNGKIDLATLAQQTG
jgi:amino acid adenylation domain-containing protein